MTTVCGSLFAVALGLLLASPALAQAKKGSNSDSTAAPGWGEYWKSGESTPPEYLRWEQEFKTAERAKDYAKAIAACDRLLATRPDSPGAMAYRGMAKRQLKNYDGARVDLAAALSLARKNKSSEMICLACEQMAVLALVQGRPAEAQDYFHRAVREAPNAFESYNAFAWYLATSNFDTVRNGHEAVRLATKACELSRWNEASCLDTLAAACAETGDFNSAVKWQMKALELAKPSKSNLTDADRRLALYRNHLPYHTDK